jgi:hypothetical protein
MEDLGHHGGEAFTAADSAWRRASRTLMVCMNSLWRSAPQHSGMSVYGVDTHGAAYT